MSLFTCNITKEKYDFAEYNLKDLAKIIKEQYQLTNQKILSYFKEKNSQNCELTILNNFMDYNLDEIEAKEKGLVIKKYDYSGSYDYFNHYYKFPYYRSLKEILNNIEEDFKNKDITGKNFLKILGFTHENTGIYEKMTNLEEIKSRFEKIYNIVLQRYMDSRTFLDIKHRFDVNPIIINIVEENGSQIQLINGFKRLLLSNINDLDFTGVVKVYHNISDNNYIKILNATSDWTERGEKCNGGYLFALEQRFGIGKEYFKSNYMLDAVSILNSYCSYIPNYVENNMYLEDLNTIKNILNTEFVVDDAYTLAKEIVLYTFKFISTCIRAYGNMTKFDFVNMFDNTMWGLKKKISSRKNIYVDGHIQNFITKDIFPKYIEYLKHNK